MNGAGQTLTAFSSTSTTTTNNNENDVIISMHDEDDEENQSNEQIITVRDAQSTKANNRLLIKSNSVSSSCTLTSSSTYSMHADDSVPFLSHTTYFECIICLNKYNELDDKTQIFQIKSCKCKFCINCLNKYVMQCIENCDVVPVNCPDSSCTSKGHLDQNEIKLILASDQTDDSLIAKEGSILFKRYLKLCENIEILRDKTKIYCPKPNCQNICIIKTQSTSSSTSSKLKYNHIKCEKCNFEFCSQCHKKWMSNKLNKANQDLNEIVDSNSANTNNSNNKLNNYSSNETKVMLINEYCDCDASNQQIDFGIKNYQPDNLENIKRCPQCSVLIERVDGCAQIMCKFCKHCFCFYCLASLDNDFLLKHYTKNGPCKGKLGHSRMSLLMHRLSVVAIFTGTIFLILLLSPLIILTLPFLVFSSKCRKTCYQFSTKFS